ncbi:MAG: galactokinase [Spirochaetes bacterium]|nr:galactokinase [Spirochaetota bacterium]MBL7006507.1 galactokinase [Spirochaetia bacterium]
MKSANSQYKEITSGRCDTVFKEIYGAANDLPRQQARYAELLKRHTSLFGESAEYTPRIYSIPGRTELGGNHTDHNRGCVLAAGINLDTIAAAVPSDDMVVVLDSVGFDPVIVDLSDIDLETSENKTGTTESLVRGIAAAFASDGFIIGGFKANTTTDVRKGSGLSSSAAIEITIAVIFNDLYNQNRVNAITLATYSQFAENRYFGKPCGLMDQTACAYGGIVGIDFRNPKIPAITEVSYSFHANGYTLVVVDTGGNHADLTPSYTAITIEMGQIAEFFRVSYCRDISLEMLIPAIPELRLKFGDRAVLRAYHFLKETQRAKEMTEALQKNDIKLYLKLASASGDSSFKFLQNVYPAENPKEQGLSLALSLTENFLNGDGACRVHGGGFAGTIQTFIPNDLVGSYKELMQRIFGSNSVEILTIRHKPAGRVL